MTQETLVSQFSSKPRRNYRGKNEAVTVGSGDVDILEVACEGMDNLWVTLKNTHGSVAFDAVKVLTKATEDSDDAYVDITALTGLVTPSTGLQTLAAGATGYLYIKCTGLGKVKIQASTGSSGSASAYISGN